MKTVINARQTGFTLVEVMVALTVVAIALPALLFTLYQQIDGIEYLRERLEAQRVASNKMTELRLVSRARQSLLAGSESGMSTQGGRAWYWRVAPAATEVPEFFRVVVTVAAEEEALPDAPLHTLIGFMSAALAIDPNPPGEQPQDGEGDTESTQPQPPLDSEDFSLPGQGTQQGGSQ